MSNSAALRHPAFFWGIIAVLALAAGFSIWNGATGQSTHAMVWTGIAAVGAAAVYGRGRLPPLFGLLLLLTAAVNGAGYTLSLWREDTMFDELVHAFTSFAGMAAIGWGILKSRHAPSSQTALFAVLIGIGLGIGLLWEGFEWLIGIIGSARDTWIDMAMDGLGAAAAAVLTCSLHSKIKQA